MLALSAPSLAQLRERADTFRQALEDNLPPPTSSEKTASDRFRLAVVGDTYTDLKRRLSEFISLTTDQTPARLRRANGLYFNSRPMLHEGGLAFVFPGEGASYEGMLADLVLNVPSVHAVFDETDAVFINHSRGVLPSERLYGPRAKDLLLGVAGAIETVMTGCRALTCVLGELGITPEASVGHSSGEYAALAWNGERAGVQSSWLDILKQLDAFESEVTDLSGLPSVEVTSIFGAPRLSIDYFVERHPDVHLALDNSPDQVVLCGPSGTLNQIRAQLVAEGGYCQPLPLARPYHTPLYRPYADALAKALDRMPLVAGERTYSCATCAPHSQALPELRKAVHSQWFAPVRFRQTIEAMYAEGCRVFLEVGPRGNLAGAIDRTLQNQPHATLPCDVEHSSSGHRLAHLVAEMTSHGADLKLVERWNTLRLGKTRAKTHQPVQPKHEAPHAGIITRDKQLHVDVERVKARIAAAAQRPAASNRTSLRTRARTMTTRLSLATHPFLKHHTLSRNVSERDMELLGLSVVPLTFTLELIIEAAICAHPGHTLAGVSDFRQSRFAPVAPYLDLQTTVGPLRHNRCHVDVTTPGRTDICASGDVRLGREPVLAPTPTRGPLVNAHRSPLTSTSIYEERMFHGPLLQGVKEMGTTSARGCDGTLTLLPTEPLFPPHAAANFVTDPVLLDAAGQVVALWAQEYIGDMAWFPHTVETLDWYGQLPRRPASIACRVDAHATDTHGLSAAIELVDTNERLLCRIVGWQDRGFEEPAGFRRLRINPQEAFLSERMVGSESEEVRHLSGGIVPFLRGGGGIFAEILAQQILTRTERTRWCALGSDEATVWLVKRCAAKEAVRGLLARSEKRLFAPADVDVIFENENTFHSTDYRNNACSGRVHYDGGAWTATARAAPLAHPPMLGARTPTPGRDRVGHHTKEEY